MTGDIWLVREIGGPWYARAARWIITLLKYGLHTRYCHAMMEAGEKGGEPLLISAEGGGCVWRNGGEFVDRLHAGKARLTIRRNAELTESGRATLYGAAHDSRQFDYSESTLVAHLFGWRFAAWVARLNPADKICSELVAWIFEKIGYRFRKRHSARILPPEAVRPRDIEETTRHLPWVTILEQ